MTHLKGVSGLRSVPSLRARIVSLNGVPAEKAQVAPGSQWALRGDRGLTYAAKVPKARAWSKENGGRPIMRDSR